MAVVVLPYTYVDGHTLDAEGHNRNLFDPARGNGVYSELNGGIEGGNLSSDFEVTPDLVQPEQVTFARAYGAVSTLDNMGDVNLNNQEDSAESTLKNQALPGCGIRVYLPFAASMVLWEVSYFWHVAKFKPPNFGGDNDPVAAEPPNIITRMYVDGVGHFHTQRGYPATLFQNDDQVSFVDQATANRQDQQRLTTTERALSQHHDIAHLSLSLSAGWHEMYLAFFVQPRATSNANPITLDDLRGFAGTGAENAVKNVHLESRWTVGCRNARVCAFL